MENALTSLLIQERREKRGENRANGRIGFQQKANAYSPIRKLQTRRERVRWQWQLGKYGSEGGGSIRGQWQSKRQRYLMMPNKFLFHREAVFLILKHEHRANIIFASGLFWPFTVGNFLIKTKFILLWWRFSRRTPFETKLNDISHKLRNDTNNS